MRVRAHRASFNYDNQEGDGLQTGISFHDTGFAADFKDPWPSSDNQVGHFLTAVGLSFNPAKVKQSFGGRSLRDWLGAPAAMSD